MKKKTAVTELKQWVKDQIPAAGTNERLLALQSVMSNVAYEIQTKIEAKEKEQLRDAFNKGVVHGMLLANAKHDQSDNYNYNGFEQYFKEKYGDEA